MEAGPEVLSWQLLEPQLLFILVNYQDYQFAGTLMLEARSVDLQEFALATPSPNSGYVVCSTHLIMPASSTPSTSHILHV